MRLFLPCFNQATVKGVIDELQNIEGGNIPTVIDEEASGQNKYAILTVHIPKRTLRLFRDNIMINFHQCNRRLHKRGGAPAPPRDFSVKTASARR